MTIEYLSSKDGNENFAVEIVTDAEIIFNFKRADIEAIQITRDIIGAFNEPDGPKAANGKVCVILRSGHALDMHPQDYDKAKAVFNELRQWWLNLD